MLTSWATILTTYTVLLQNSCTPLLEWTNTSARDCPTKLADFSSNHFSKSLDTRQQKTDKALNDFNSAKVREAPSPRVGNSNSSKLGGSENSLDRKPNGGNAGKEIIGAAAASVAAIGLAVIEAPVVVIAGVGFAVWLAARTLFSLGK